MPQRDYYVDRLRAVMTALVLLHHTAITYGASGGWFHYELKPSSSPTSLLLTLFCATNQAYFMGFFFLLAGYFTPHSLERKGYARFLGDRFLRLGLPLAVFCIVLGPLTVAIDSASQGHGFWSTLAVLWQQKPFINGPLWFVQALLIFTVVYCLWRRWFGALLTAATQSPSPVPSHRAWLLGAIGVGLAAFAIRFAVPAGQNVFGMQLGYFASYIFLFAIGIAAWRHDWFNRLRWPHARPWIIALLVAWPALPVAIAVVLARSPRNLGSFIGGFSWPALLYAFWEPFVAWGLIAAWLLLFHARMNQPSSFWNWLNRRAYAVYILHPPVLVGLSMLLHPWVAPAFLKFAVVGALTIAATWLVADPFVRLPGFRRVV